MTSMTRQEPVEVVYVDSRTALSPTYRRLHDASSAGPRSHRPCSGPPRSAAKQAWESKRGRQSQSTEPSRPISAAVPESPTSA
jgi:hypothetical protein